MAGEQWTQSYRMCFATSESGGESASDFVELDGKFRVINAPSFKPRIAVKGSTQQLNVTGDPHTCHRCAMTVCVF